MLNWLGCLAVLQLMESFGVQFLNSDPSAGMMLFNSDGCLLI